MAIPCEGFTRQKHLRPRKRETGHTTESSEKDYKGVCDSDINIQDTVSNECFAFCNSLKKDSITYNLPTMGKKIAESVLGVDENSGPLSLKRGLERKEDEDLNEERSKQQKTDDHVQTGLDLDDYDLEEDAFPCNLRVDTYPYNQGANAFLYNQGVAAFPDGPFVHAINVSNDLEVDGDPDTGEFVPPDINIWRYEENRRNSFVNWPKEQTVKIFDLARNGFIYTGSGDKVLCVFCNRYLLDWEPGDIPGVEHGKYSPHCKFINGENVGNVPCVLQDLQGCHNTGPSRPASRQQIEETARHQARGEETFQTNKQHFQRTQAHEPKPSQSNEVLGRTNTYPHDHAPGPPTPQGLTGADGHNQNCRATCGVSHYQVTAASSCRRSSHSDTQQPDDVQAAVPSSISVPQLCRMNTEQPQAISPHAQLPARSPADLRPLGIQTAFPGHVRQAQFSASFCTQNSQHLLADLRPLGNQTAFPGRMRQAQSSASSCTQNSQHLSPSASNNHPSTTSNHPLATSNHLSATSKLPSTTSDLQDYPNQERQHYRSGSEVTYPTPIRNGDRPSGARPKERSRSSHSRIGQLCHNPPTTTATQHTYSAQLMLKGRPTYEVIHSQYGKAYHRDSTYPDTLPQRFRKKAVEAGLFCLKIQTGGTENTDNTDKTTDCAESDDAGESNPPEKRKFQARWLQQYPWLLHDEKKNKMFCKICSEAGKTNTMAVGTDNFKTSTLSRHVVGADHQQMLNAPMEKKNMQTAVTKALDKEEKGVIVALKAVHWLAKEGLPLTKYTSLIKFLKQVETPNTESLNVNDRVDYSSYTTAKGLLSSLSNVIDARVSNAIRDSPVVTILTDESTDIVVHHKLCINVRVVDPLSLEPSTLFLTDVRLDSGTGKAIFDEIESQLKSRNINIKTVMGLGTDGASTMTGTKEGLTGHFLRVNPHLANTHCVAHRLALCSEQATQNVPAMSEFQRTLEMIYYHFRKSPNKVDQVEAVQKILDEPTIKYREVHQVRWLSFYNALDAIYRTMDSLITYLHSVSEKDPSAAGIKKRVANELFISLTYAMMDILQPIMKLSLFFQTKNLDIGLVQVSVNECVRSLEEIRDDLNPLQKPTFSSQLKDDMKPGVFKGHKIAKLQSSTQFTNVKKQFITALLENISKRFPDNQLLTSFSVLALRPITFLDDTELEEWGNDSIQHLVDFYGQVQEHAYKNPVTKVVEIFTSPAVVDPVEVKVEWRRLKKVVKDQKYPRPSMASVWSLIAQHHREQFPNLIVLASLALTHPVHTADCERSFSTQNQVTTALRNRLSPESCGQLMRVMIEGETLEKFDFVAALMAWRNVRDRLIFQRPCHDKSED